ncbi:MAG: hypothetical protein TREMPRED_005592 [Tremellales sp. Tagirdzhanova-0007]|nr:MAG: hypothetical protein TREMPRED_005592 [Tremellales sp. Tagirdzhanova-0007]
MATAVDRRSVPDLQRILDSLIGPEGFVLSANLPDVLSEYENHHDLVILDASEYDGLRTLCSQHSDLELGPKELYNFLNLIPKPRHGRSAPAIPAPRLPHSASLPPVSFREAQSTPTQPFRAGSRRHSDRIRSPSESSSSESEIEPVTISGPPAPPKLQTFPSSGIPVSIQSRPLPPPRSKTLSESSRLGLLLSTKARGHAGPPSAFVGVVPFARPSPANRRRRLSAEGATFAGEAIASSSDLQPARPYDRISSNSFRITSPSRNADLQSQPDSSISSTHGLDHTSFHARAKSPDEGEDEQMLLIRNMQVDIINFDAGRVEEVVDKESFMRDKSTDDSLDPRLSRISTDSTTSLTTSHDKLQGLQRHNTELARKLKDSEKQLAVLGVENERLVEDLQDRLEEARAEVLQRRKDEKEMKGKEKAQLIQITGFEADIQSLQKSLENSKANHASMQKMYNSQCDEAQRLRDLLRDRDAVVKELEIGIQAHEADEKKSSREIKALEIAIKRLETDLSVSRQAESGLQVQKQENLALKETIDRMRFELDEASATDIKTGSMLHQRAGTSGPQTLSRNLGDELSRRLIEVERVRQESEEGDSVVETIVTTQRTRKIGTRIQPAENASGNSSAPLGHVEEIVREYADAATETETPPESPRESTSAMPPAYSAKPESANAVEVLEQAHPREQGHHGDGEDEYEALVDALGVRCTILEKEIQLKKAESVPRDATSASKHIFSARNKSYLKPGIVNNIYYYTADSLDNQVSKLGAWTVIVFAFGIVAGSHFFGPPAGLHPRDLHLFAQMNNLAMAAGAGEGILPIGHRGLMGVVGAGAGMVAGRVPT